MPFLVDNPSESVVRTATTSKIQPNAGGLSDQAGIGLTPHSTTNDDSILYRLVLSPSATKSVSATFTPSPNLDIKLRAVVSVSFFKALSRYVP